MLERRTEVLLFRWCAPHHFIILDVLFLVLGILCTYGMAVGYEHVPELFPYISDTGAKPPSSCVFGLLLNLTAAFSFVVMVIRHGHFEKFNTLDTLRVHSVNDVALFLGFLSAFGIMLVANFQETAVLTVHLIGATLTFGCGIVYCWLHSYLTYVTIPTGSSTKLSFFARMLLTVIATVCFVGVFTGASVARSKFAHRTSNHTVIEYDANDPGFGAHLVSTFSEWIMVFSFIFFFATFYGEFKEIATSVFVCRRHEIESQNSILEQRTDPLC